MATVAAEAEDNVRRLRHHACLALWCGNNEIEQGLVGEQWTASTMSWDDYGKLFDRLLPEIVAQLDPERDYWPSSAHSPRGDRHDFNNPHWGDAHIWDVWHGKRPFEFYRTCFHRFNSEFGFQSFPEPRTVATFTIPTDRNITSYIMEHHQRSGIGNQTIIHYLLDWFRMPTSFEMTLWLSQIVQGMAVKIAVEHWRRTMPRGMGTLYWQLNDTWPGPSWSSLDYYGRWKALHYLARRFYAPLLVAGVEDLAAGTVALHVTSDLLAASSGELRWQLTTAAGDVVDHGGIMTVIRAHGNTVVETVDLSNTLARHDPRNLLLWLELRLEDSVVATDLVLLARPKQLELLDPEIATDVTAAGDGRYRVTLTAQKPALWAWLTLSEQDGRFSDNFFHLPPDRPTTVTVTPTQSTTLPTLKDALRVYSLLDTYGLP
jgi:beta-mannosidase